MRATLFCILTFIVASASADVAGDWQAVLDLDRGPDTKFQSREEAKKVTLDHLERQERAIRGFVAAHPAAPERVDAQLRLARIYMVRGDLMQDPELARRAFATLDEIAASPLLPAERRADVDFARLSLEMRQARSNLEKTRDGLVTKAEAFAKAHPGDRRIAALMVELSGVFEDRPKMMRSLLEVAAREAKDPAMRMQIFDDMKRLDMMGKTVPLVFTSIAGESVDLKTFRGKVVIVCFFAGWSPPSIISLAKVEELTRNFPSHQVRTLGISLDGTTADAKSVASKLDIEWPIFCDGKGWEGPLVRSLGINSLPTVWIFDRRGRLRVLNAPEEPSTAVKQLIRER